MYFSTEPVRIEDHRVRHWQIGTLSLWVRRSENSEWLVANRQVPGADEVLEEAAVLDEEPDGLKWQRYAVPESEPTLSLMPQMPDRPLIVRPETPLTIATGGEGVFYALLPCWIDLAVGEGTKIVTIPSVRLSGSWFGEPVSGELCYAMRTNARRGVEDLPPRPHRAVCTLRIANRDAKPLEVQRVCLHVGPLAIYRGTAHLWTSEVTLTNTAGNEPTEPHYGTATPAADPHAELLSPAREPRDPKSLKARFKAMRSFIA